MNVLEQYLSQDFWNQFLIRMLDWLVINLPSLLVIIVLLIFSLWLVRFLIRKTEKILIRRGKNVDENFSGKEKRIRTLLGIIRGASVVSIWIIFLMLFLNKFGVNIGPILAGAGIVGLAIGFGSQELVRDIISGFFILLENQIRVGDVAIINGTGGVVESIELRTITLRDGVGGLHVFQQGKITTLTNLTMDWSAHMFEIGVSYKEEIGKVESIIANVVESMMKRPDFMDKIISPAEIFGLDRFGESSLIIKGRIKTKPGAQWPVGRAFNKEIKNAFERENIEIPYPHTNIILDNKKTNFDRPLKKSE